MHSHAQVMELTEQALQITPDTRARGRLQEHAALSASSLARHDVAIDLASDVLADRRAGGDPAEVADAAAVLARVLCTAYRPKDAIEVLEPLVTTDTVFDDEPIVRAGAQLSRAYLLALRDEESADVADRVAGAAERLAMTPTILDVMITRGTALGNLGRLHEAIALLRGASRYAEEHDVPNARLRAANNVGHLLAFDDHHGALEACHQGMVQAERLGEVSFFASFAWAVSSYWERDGRFEEARSLRDDVRDRFDLPPGNRGWYRLADLLAAVEQGDEAAMASTYELLERLRHDENPQSQAAIPATEAKLDIFSGRYERAFAAIMEMPESHRFPGHYGIAAVAAAMLRDDGKLDEVRAALTVSPSRGRMLGAVMEVVAGSRHAIAGRTAEAVRAFERVLSFRFLRVDEATWQGLFAAVVGREVAEARAAGDRAFATLSEVGALAYVDLFGAGMPSPEERLAAGS